MQRKNYDLPNPSIAALGLYLAGSMGLRFAGLPEGNRDEKDIGLG
jgi:hypothetical protein